MGEQQKERFSRAFIVAAAASASEDYTYTIHPDDIEGVDMTVRHRGVSLDFQLKATAHPEERNGKFVLDLDVRTYDLLATTERSGLGVLAFVVVPSEPDLWITVRDEATMLTHCAYYLTLTGMGKTSNTSTIRLRIPRANRLTPSAVRALMSEARARLK